MTTAVTARAATPELVRLLVGEVLRQKAVQDSTGPIVIGVRAAPRWDGGPIDANGRLVPVIACASPLAMRAAFAEHLPDPSDALGADGPRTVLVVLTDLAEADLGDDLVARFVKPRLFGLDPWQAVRARLGVRRLDPALGEPAHRWLADALLGVPTHAGRQRHAVLSIDRAVDLVAGDAFGLDHVTVDQVLLAADDPATLARFRAAPDVVRAGVASELADRFGPVGALVLGAITTGNGASVLPLGLACRTLVGRVAGSYGQSKIETLTGVPAPEDAAVEALADAAENAFVDLERSAPRRVDAVLAEADVWVRDLQAPDAAASAVLHIGFDARLGGLGAAITGLLGALGSSDDLGGPALAVRRAVERVQSHREARGPAGDVRADGGVLAARLALWLATPASPRSTDLAAAVSDYVGDGAWVDWARRRVFAGDTNDALAAAMQAVGAASDERRAVTNRQFAEALARSTVHGDPAATVGDAMPVEAVLDELVAPLAASVPVLVVVLDGCGLPGYLELAGQLRALGLLEYARAGRRHVGLAALPTVTAASRTSLLAGQLLVGDQAVEKREFARHPALTRSGGRAPVVFHSADLRSEAGLPLPAAVRDALRPDGPRVVAAVVNTIDDQLSRGTFTAAHRIEDLGPLRWLLSAAIDAGRAVVITADHGHVLGVGTDGRGAAAIGGEGGERWRVADRAPSDDEVLLRGPRVLLGGDAGVLAPWHDVLRYAGFHGGYHGGATPDEVLVPLSVSFPAGIDVPAGWEQVAVPTPAWWDLAVVASAPATDAPPRATRRKTATKPSVDQGALFDTAPVDAPSVVTPSGAPAWVDAVLASEVFGIQRSALGRIKPPQDRTRAVLAVLAERGGVASFATIAAAAAMPLGRVAPLLAVLTRLMNVDGYAVLTVDQGGEEARLDEALARTQFLGPS